MVLEVDVTEEEGLVVEVFISSDALQSQGRKNKED
jgi:hypothetical protein